MLVYTLVAILPLETAALDHSRSYYQQVGSPPLQRNRRKLEKLEVSLGGVVHRGKAEKPSNVSNSDRFQANNLQYHRAEGTDLNIHNNVLALDRLHGP